MNILAVEAYLRQHGDWQTVQYFSARLFKFRSSFCVSVNFEQWSLERFRIIDTLLFFHD